MSPVLDAEFTNWDDPDYIYNNLLVTDNNSVIAIFKEPTRSIYTPLTILSFWIEHQLFGIDKIWVLHLNNLILHLFNVLLCFFIARRLGLSLWGAAVLALLFGIHPMKVESVAWLTERKDMLFGFFSLASIYYYLLIREVSKIALSKYLSLLFFVLMAMLSKVVAVILPVLFLAIDYYLDKELKVQSIKQKIPLLILSVIFGLLGLYFASIYVPLEEPEYVLSLSKRIVLAGYATSVYVVKLFFPFNLRPIYEFPFILEWHHYLGFIFAVLLFLSLLYSYLKRYTVWVFGISFFLVSIFFCLQIIKVGHGFQADRFMYLPYIGLSFIIVKWAENNYDQYRYALLGMLSTYTVFFSYSSFNQTKVWHNSESLWLHQQKYGGADKSTHLSLAEYYEDVNNKELRLQSLLRAERIDPSDITICNELGKIYLELYNDPKNAINHFDKAIDLDKTYAGIYVNRAVALGKLGEYDSAIADLTAAIELKNDNEDALLNRAVIYNSIEKYEEAINDLDSYLTLVPSSADRWVVKAQIHMKLNQVDQALISVNRGIGLNKIKGVYYFERALIYHALGNLQAAKLDILKSKNLNYQDRDEIAQQILSE